MRVLICGDRHYQDQFRVWETLDGLYSTHDVGWGAIHLDPFVVIDGCATGADTSAFLWVKRSPLHAPEMTAEAWEDWKNNRSGGIDLHGSPVISLRYPANWTEYGKAAGPIRNFEMLNSGKPDIVIGFHDNIENSKGTRHMLDIAKGAGVLTYLITRW